jgi:hypothetical protein
LVFTLHNQAREGIEMAFNHEKTNSGTRVWTARVLTTLVAVAFVGSAITKLAHLPQIIEQLTHAGIPEIAIVPIGVLELCLAVLYLLPRTSVLGTFLLSGFVGGAIVTHIIGRESFAPPLIIGLLMFAGAYFRHEKLREIVPLQSQAGSRDRGAGSALTALN